MSNLLEESGQILGDVITEKKKIEAIPGAEKEKKNGKKKEKEEVDESEAAAKKAIKALMDTNFSGNNEAQGKMAQLIRGLAFSEEDISNKFMAELDKAVTTIGKKVLGETSEASDHEDEDEEEEDDEEEKENGKKKKKTDMKKEKESKKESKKIEERKKLTPDDLLIERASNLLM